MGIIMAPRFVRKLALWLILALLSVGSSALLYQQELPGAFMLGPMGAALAMALCGAGLRLHRNFSLAAQSVMGCLIAALVTPPLLAVYLDYWLELSVINVVTLGVITLIAVIVTQRQWLPNTTAIWGLFPGAASAMVFLADTHHSDPRVVALMQYSRIALVTLASISLAAMLGHAGGTAQAIASPLKLTWSLPEIYSPALAGLALALCGFCVAKLSGVGSLALLLPALGGTVLQATGTTVIDTPAYVFVPAFVITGWYVGLTFSRSSVRHCLSLLPVILSTLVAVILVCGLLSLVLALLIPDIDPLTAYLALSPGGIETIVIIASDVDVFLPLILASQFLRLIMVLSVGPTVAKAVATWQSKK
nr:AbrB family transcriptional regulator [Pseudomonas sp. ALS1279]